MLQLISSSQSDSAGLKFNVTVVSSEKDVLLVAASVSGQSVGTTTLKNAVITALSASGSGSDITMTLESARPAEMDADQARRPRGGVLRQGCTSCLPG